MHQGRSINHLLDELGHTGLCFFLIQEMCAEKLEASAAGVDKSATTFEFHPRIVRQKLRISPANLRRLLDVCAANGLLSFEISEKSVKISMPILLELLDRDAKNARKTRETNAQKTRLDKEEDKIKNKKKSIYSESAHSRFNTLCSLFLETFPNTTKGPKAEARFMEQFPDGVGSDDLEKAIHNYKKRLDHDNRHRVWRQPKTTFETFLGTSRSGQFWRDYVSFELVEENKTDDPIILDESLRKQFEDYKPKGEAS